MVAWSYCFAQDPNCIQDPVSVCFEVFIVIIITIIIIF